MSEKDKDEAAERKAKAARAKKLLAARQKAKAASAAPPSEVGSQRTSLSLDDSVREELRSSVDTTRAEEVSGTATEASIKPDVPTALEDAEKQDAKDYELRDIKETSKEEKKDEAIADVSAQDIDAVEEIVEEPPTGKSSNKKKGKDKVAMDHKEAGGDAAADKDDESKGVEETTYPGVDPAFTAKHEKESATTTAQPTTDSLGNLQQTVSLLISERTELQNQVSRLTVQFNSAKTELGLLDEARGLVLQLEKDKADLEKRIEQVELEASKVEHLKRDLEESRSKATEAEQVIEKLRKELDQSKTALEEASKSSEEQVEDLEKSLARSREREGGLEVELGRLRTTISELQGASTKREEEHEALIKSSSEESGAFATLRSTHDELQTRHVSITTNFDQLKSAHSTLEEEHKALQETHQSSGRDQSKTQEELSKLKSDLEHATARLDTATKKGGGAEKKRAALQEENAELVKQLEEVRGRVVQVMEEKVDLAGRVESLETKSKAWEREKEAQLEEITSLRSQAEVLAEDHRASSSRADQLQSDLETSRSNLSTVQNDHQTSQLRVKELESTEGKDEALTSLQSSHALELSRQSETIRSLEAALHSAESRVHALSRQLTEIQSSYAESPSRGIFIADESPSLSRTPNRPTGVDALLPAHVRHKRQVSLTALKARMQPTPRSVTSPMGSLAEQNESRRSSMSTPGGGGKKVANGFSRGKQQIGDEIVFCCPACEGDLITL